MKIEYKKMDIEREIYVWCEEGNIVEKNFQEKEKRRKERRGSYEKRDENEESVRKYKVRIVYWNIAGMKKKGKEF